MADIQLILRADDIGYSEAVNYGIEKSVKEGLIRSAGLMPNMPAAAHGLKLLAGTSICLGQHTNLCLGRPCADPARVPSLLDADGNLKSSRAYREAWARGEEFTVLEEMVLEVEAQYFRFRELTGQDPEYFEAHAVISDNLNKALAIVAEQYHLPYFSTTPRTRTGSFKGKPIAVCPMDSMHADYDPWQSLKNAVNHAVPGIPNVFICHPGYLDDYILHHSSLTINRTKEVAMLCDPDVRQWLEAQQVELISYRDI